MVERSDHACCTRRCVRACDDFFQGRGRMNQQFVLARQNEQGGARLKFIIAITVFAIVVYAGYLYLPVAVDAYYFKDVMQNKVDVAVTQGYEAPWVSDQLKKTAAEFHVPDNAI